MPLRSGESGLVLSEEGKPAGLSSGAGPHRGGPLRPQREGTRGGGGPAPGAAGAATMIALFNKLLDWFKALFWKEEMELTLVGLQYSGKTTFVNVIAVRPPAPSPRRAGLSGHLGVNDLVSAQGAGLPEALSTHFANEGSGSCVHRHVTG